MSISKETRDIAMRIIIDFHQRKESRSSISPLYLSHHGLPEGTDAVQVVKFLHAMGLVSYVTERNGSIHNIQPTDSGLTYFEKEEDEKEKLKKIFRHDWMIAFFSTIVGALLSKPIWSVISWILDQLKQ